MLTPIVQINELKLLQMVFVIYFTCPMKLFPNMIFKSFGAGGNNPLNQLKNPISTGTGEKREKKQQRKLSCSKLVPVLEEISQ